MKMEGIITRKYSMKDGEFSRCTIPVEDYVYKNMERMSPFDVIYELYVYDPFVGGIAITEDNVSGPKKVYKGCPMLLDGAFYSVLYYGYQWIREKLHLEVFDNIDSKLGPTDFYHSKHLTTLYFLMYDWTPISECFYCRYSIILYKNYKTPLYIWYFRGIWSLSKSVMHGGTYTFEYLFSYVLRNAASAV